MPRLTLNGDEECEDEERGEDVGGEDFVRERHLFNSIYSCEKGKDEVVLFFISTYDMILMKELACQVGS